MTTIINRRIINENGVISLKVSNEFVVRSLMGEYVIVPVGSNATKFNGIISTNSTGAFLWELLQNDISEDELIQKLKEEYDVSDEDAKEDVHLLISELSKHNILQES